MLAADQAAPRVLARARAFAQRLGRFKECSGDGRTVANGTLRTIPHLSFRCVRVRHGSQDQPQATTVCSARRDAKCWRVLGIRSETDHGLEACKGRVAYTTAGGLSAQLSLNIRNVEGQRPLHPASQQLQQPGTIHAGFPTTASSSSKPAPSGVHSSRRRRTQTASAASSAAAGSHAAEVTTAAPPSPGA